MSKLIGSIILLGLLVLLLIMNTPVNRLGSGFLVGGARHVLTYYDLAKEADTFLVKFPNEDDIPAKLVFKDPGKNLAILELDQPAKVKTDPLSLSEANISNRDNYVFTLGYPWTNTLEDRHTLIEGFRAKNGLDFSDLMAIDLVLEPVHSGSPLMDRKNEVIGMVLTVGHAVDYYPVDASGNNNYAIPSSTLIKALQALKLLKSTKSPRPDENLSRDEFIEAVRNNVVLIEAR